ncbi:GLPGLI family protein [Algoriella xinjiangensis]|uniref:GLPGLI family protein n=1 Tax=Algoriella xinjiangensis TaxID=684065 RepID=A0A1I4VDX7_9FLAO|nr:GLPGLI family protein [Algoriella xinjiangensis]SFM99348.1 GLPGLI family protein [Algoriella xinjiangensis]VDH17121.1 GLPGLI family protein [Algoriella xinjiangensis]
MKNIFAITAIFLSAFSFAQSEKFEVTYSTRLILPEDFTFQPPGGGNGRQMSKEMIDEMKKRMQEPQTNTLTIFGDQSIYKPVEKISNDQQNNSNGRGGMRIMRTSGDNIYKDISTKIYFKDVNMFSKSYTVKDNLPNYDWKMTRETKKILGNDARKATLEKDGNITTAWYAVNIPSKSGPENYWGLPGLILEVETETQQGQIKGKKIITITDIKTSTDNKAIEVPKAKSTITEADLEKLQKEQRQRFEEMRNEGVNKKD